jgi:hypothetical protein
MIIRGLIRASAWAATGLALAVSNPGVAGLEFQYEGRVEIGFANPIFLKDGNAQLKDRVSVSYPNGTATVDAGAFRGTSEEPGTGYDGFNPEVLYRNSLGDVILYCVDLYQPIGGGWNPVYDVYSLTLDSGKSPNTGTLDDPDRNFDRVMRFLGAMNVVLGDSYGYSEAEYNWLNPRNAAHSGAIQLGLWESLYESDESAWDLGADAFRVTGTGSNGLLDEGSKLLGEVFGRLNDSPASVIPLAPKNVLILTNGNRQDMIVGDPVPVPVPGTALLLLGGLVLVSRRR